MKGMVKALIIGAVIIGIGIAVLIIGLGLNGWKLPLHDVKFEMQTFTETGEADNIVIDIDAGELKIEFYDGDKITVDYAVAEGFSSEMDENTENGSITLKTPRKKWFLWGIIRTEMPNTVVKIPEGRRVNLSVDMDAGSVNIAGGEYKSVSIDMDAGALNTGAIVCDGDFRCDIDAGTACFTGLSCEKFDSKISAGNLTVKGLTANSSYIRISAGEANLSYTGAKAEYGVTTKISAGSCNVYPQSGTTQKSIDVKISAGKATLKFAN